MSPTIELTHFLRGKMKVRVNDDHTYYLRSRQWEDTNSDGKIYDDGAFTESREEIDARLSEAEREEQRSCDELFYETMQLANYCKEV